MYYVAPFIVSLSTSALVYIRVPDYVLSRFEIMTKCERIQTTTVRAREHFCPNERQGILPKRIVFGNLLRYRGTVWCRADEDGV